MLLLMKYLYIYETCKELCVCVRVRACTCASICVHFWMYLCIDCMKLCIYTYVVDESRKVHFHTGKCCFSVVSCSILLFAELDSVILYIILPNCLQFSWNDIQLFVHATYLQFIFNV